MDKMNNYSLKLHNKIFSCLVFSLFFFLFLAIAGCAVNDVGLVTVDRYENDTARMARLKTLGLHLITNSVDGGLTIGASNRVYIYPKHNQSNAYMEEIKRFLTKISNGEQLQMKNADSFPPFSELGTPISVVSERFGISLDFNSHRIGISIGWRLNHAIRLPIDFQGDFFLKFDPEDLARTQIHTSENVQ